MSAGIICISDIHGAFYTLMRLLAKCPQDAQLVFLGDLIDRAPHSRKVIEFAMENEIPTVAGNHEDLCLAFYNHKGAKCANMYERSIWLSNGGDKAVKNWPTIDKRTLTPFQVTQAKGLGGRVPDSVLDWFASLPAYIIPDAPPDENGRKLFCSHTGYGLAADDGDWLMTLWGKHSAGDGEFPDDGYYRVFGHVRAEKPTITEQWARIDTGAAYRAPYGVMTAFHWPSKRVIQQAYDESIL